MKKRLNEKKLLILIKGTTCLFFHKKKAQHIEKGKAKGAQQLKGKTTNRWYAKME